MESLRIDLDDPRTTAYPKMLFQITYSRHEDLAGNLLHVILFILALVLFVVKK